MEAVIIDCGLVEMHHKKEKETFKWVSSSLKCANGRNFDCNGPNNCYVLLELNGFLRLVQHSQSTVFHYFIVLLRMMVMKN